MSDAYNSVKDGVESVHKGVNDQVWQTKHPAARPFNSLCSCFEVVVGRV